MKRQIAEVDEMLEALSDQPLTAEALRLHADEQLGVAWETVAQARFRVGWLELLGAVRTDGNMVLLA